MTDKLIATEISEIIHRKLPLMGIPTGLINEIADEIAWHYRATHQPIPEQAAGGEGGALTEAEIDKLVAEDLEKSNEQIWAEAVQRHGSPAAALREADRIRNIIKKATDEHCVKIECKFPQPLPAETGADGRGSEENVELVENALCRVCEAENTYELCPDNVQLTKLAKAAITALQTKGDHHG